MTGIGFASFPDYMATGSSMESSCFRTYIHLPVRLSIPSHAFAGGLSYLFLSLTLLFFLPPWLLAAPLAGSPQFIANMMPPLGTLPPGAVPVIVRAMQRDLPAEYRLEKDGSEYRMSNPANGINISFSESGPEMLSGNTSWKISMTGMGYEGSIQPAEKARLANDDGRMVYDRGNVEEWYLNSRWGVEQGFTIQTSPAGKNGKFLIVELSISGDVETSLDGNSLVLADAQGRRIAGYSGLQVFDSQSKVLASHLTLAGSTLRIHVDDTHARYPVTIDPWLQAVKLTASDGARFDYFGTSVAISGDTIVVGAPYDDVNGFDSGSAYVFVRGPGGWTQANETAKLTASDGADNDHFGSSVAIDGDTIVVGAPFDDDNGDNSGSVYVFVKETSGWASMTETEKLTAGDGAGQDYFGTSVTISGDAIVVGAPYDDDNGGNSGSAYVFVMAGSGLVTIETAKIVASDGVDNDFFGTSVAISGDTVVVGAYGDDNENGSNAGSAYVFVIAGSGLATLQTAKIIASDGAGNDRFGVSVAISGDTIVVGAPYDDNERGADSGSAYVFVIDDNGRTTVERAKLTASDGADNDRFGGSVAISGGTIVVGATYEAERYNLLPEAAYVYVKGTSGWSTMRETVKLAIRDGAKNDGFGKSVAISTDSAIVIGAPYDDVGGFSFGAVHVYVDRLATSLPWLHLLLNSAQ